MVTLYSETTNQHFEHPCNQLRDREPFDFDGRGIFGNFESEDQLVIYLVIDLETEIIKDCKWQIIGMKTAIAGVSVLSEMVKGMVLSKSLEMSVYHLIKQLGGFPDDQIQVIANIIKTLKLAINNFYEENGLEHKTSDDFALRICKCMDVSDQQIEAAVKNGAHTFEKVQTITKCSTGCGTCAEKVQALITSYL
ncbi:MAG: iron-sulfur cluster assembly scaffold protein [Deltaproteobacteria bacterium]|jgi:nitrogen fixation protein NifU and related proteins|nr:iron-sulfur cluster assembly scaffold protein [Deltaproteobacteria bacterium]MBT4525735.1 iron-sulfur cluster assembly scaffold protein [Deltaproteobacteria bacterium]